MYLPNRGEVAQRVGSHYYGWEVTAHGVGNAAPRRHQRATCNPTARLGGGGSHDVEQWLAGQVPGCLIGDEGRRTGGEVIRVAADVRGDEDVRQAPLRAVGR